MSLKMKNGLKRLLHFRIIKVLSFFSLMFATCKTLLGLMVILNYLKLFKESHLCSNVT